MYRLHRHNAISNSVAGASLALSLSLVHFLHFPLRYSAYHPNDIIIMMMMVLSSLSSKSPSNTSHYCLFFAHSMYAAWWCNNNCYY